jgi:hypothetical protein
METALLQAQSLDVLLVQCHATDMASRDHSTRHKEHV